MALSTAVAAVTATSSSKRQQISANSAGNDATTASSGCSRARDEEQENLGSIDICVCVELVAQKTDGSSIDVNFFHAILSIAIDMAIGFNSANVEMEEEMQCCVGGKPEAIVQVEFVNICLSTNSSGMRFESLDSYRLSQSLGEGFGTLFDAKTLNVMPMSEVMSVAVNGNGNKLKITTQLANFFFLKRLELEVYQKALVEEEARKLKEET
eukprot:scaffold206805_cov42-Attheya_sp.AAC.2